MRAYSSGESEFFQDILNKCRAGGLASGLMTQSPMPCVFRKPGPALQSLQSDVVVQHHATVGGCFSAIGRLVNVERKMDVEK